MESFVRFKFNRELVMSKYFTTAAVDAVSAANIYVDPAVWSKIIVHPKGRKPNWLAIHLLSRILYWYGRSEVRDEDTGKLLGYKKKFKYDMLQMSYDSIMEQMGCTYKEARTALACLVSAGIMHTELRSFDWKGNVMFIEPKVAAILCIINPKGVHNAPPLPLQVQTPLPPQGKPSAPAGAESTLSTTLTSETLFSTKEQSKGGSSVDNSEQLPTSSSPPSGKVLKKEESDRLENIKRVKRLLMQTTDRMRVRRG